MTFPTSSTCFNVFLVEIFLFQRPAQQLPRPCCKSTYPDLRKFPVAPSGSPIPRKTMVRLRRLLPGFVCHMGYPLVNCYITMERSTIFNGKIHYKWPFSIAMLNYQRVPRFMANAEKPSKKNGGNYLLLRHMPYTCHHDVVFCKDYLGWNLVTCSFFCWSCEITITLW